MTSPTVAAPQPPAAPGTVATPSKPATPGAFLALYRLVLRHQVTKGRLLLFALILGLSIVLGAVIGADGDNQIRDAIDIIRSLGFGLIVPVVPLVLGSAALGNWVDDETLVYVWLRPVRRSAIAAATTLAAATVAVPAVVVPMGVLAGLSSGGDRDIVIGTLIASALASLTYTSLFVLIGLLLRRALLWGLVYVFVWEFVVASAGAGAARFSINSYAASVLSHYSGADIPLGDRALWTSYAITLGLTVIGTALTTWRLNRANVA